MPHTHEHSNVRLIRDMTHAEVVAAAEKARGRNWYAADCYALTDFGDCARAEVYWADGAAEYMLHDSRDEALEHLRALGADTDSLANRS